jgi:uncharacterized membrane protein
MNSSEPPPPAGAAYNAPGIFEPSGPVAVSTGRWIGEAWNLVTSQLLMYALATLVFAALQSVPLIQGALLAGFYLFCMRHMMEGRVDVGDLFKGFNYFVPTLIIALLSGVFLFLGMLACIVPAFVVGAMYMFPYLFAVDRKMDFWPAMQSSHNIVKKDYFGFTLFFLALVGLQILGALACLIGLFVSIPIMIAAITCAYRDIAGFQSQRIE